MLMIDEVMYLLGHFNRKPLPTFRKMNIHLKCPEAPEVFLPKITTLKMKWMILVSLHCGFCLHFSSQRWNSRWGSQSYYILRLCCCTGGYKGLLHHLFLIINHQNTPVISHEPLDRYLQRLTKHGGKMGPKRWGFLMFAKGQGRWISEKVVTLWLSICLTWWSAPPTRECLLEHLGGKRVRCFYSTKRRRRSNQGWKKITCLCIIIIYYYDYVSLVFLFWFFSCWK